MGFNMEMPAKILHKQWNPDAYEAEQYQRMRDARLRREVEARRWSTMWAKERARSILQRRYFSFGEFAQQLGQDPRTLETNPRLRERIIEDLTRSVQNRQFAAGKVVALTSDHPVFRALKLKPEEILVCGDEEVLALGRDACRRYVQARPELPGAPSLLRDWFGTEADALNSEQDTDGPNGAVIQIPLPKREQGESDQEATVSSMARVDAAGAVASTLPRSAPRPHALHREVQAWYVKRIKDHEARGTQTSGEGDWAAAKKEFGEKARQRQIRELRRNHAPAAWRKQGRRPKAHGPKIQ